MTVKAKTEIENGILPTLCRQCNMRCGLNIHIVNGKIMLSDHPTIPRPIHFVSAHATSVTFLSMDTLTLARILRMPI